MQTVLQELLEWLDVKIEILENEYSMSIASGIRAAKMEAEKLLEKEKEQIKTAFASGWNWNSDPEKYYQETYNQNK